MSQGDHENRATGAAFKVHSQAAARESGRGRRRNGPIITTRLHPLAEAEALRLAHGDRGRFRIVSRTVVVVVNNPRGWRP
jgi:hypothetical protein